jgi:hypothetical protein
MRRASREPEKDTVFPPANNFRTPAPPGEHAAAFFRRRLGGIRRHDGVYGALECVDEAGAHLARQITEIREQLSSPRGQMK